jgi:hypothetical protein
MINWIVLQLYQEAKMHKKYIHVCSLFVACFLAGYAVIHFTSTPGAQISRDPAAIGRIYDFSHLSGENLSTAVKQRLLAGFEVQKADGEQGIGFGHFVFIDSQGQKKFACQEFSKVLITFEADGVAVAGQAPQMEVEGACEYSTDMTKINPLWIPVAKILGEKAADGEFQFNEGKAITLRFNNLPEEWPKTWLLKSVQLKKENSPNTVTIDRQEVSRIVGHPMVLKF